MAKERRRKKIERERGGREKELIGKFPKSPRVVRKKGTSHQ